MFGRGAKKDKKDVEAPPPSTPFAWHFYHKRAKVVLYFMILYFCIVVSMLGLVSQQIHKYGRESSNYPSKEYKNALGLGLFTGVFYILLPIFHWALGYFAYFFMFFSGGIFFGTVAGIITNTPFGHGLQCRHTDHPELFPPAWVPYLHECSRVTAIVGLAWAMFALNVIGLFATFFDKFELRSKRPALFEPFPEDLRPKEVKPDEEV